MIAVTTPMKAYIVPSHVTCYPFGDPASALRVLDRPLGEALDALLAGRGLQVVRVEDRAAVHDAAPHLVLADNLWLTEEALAHFMAEAARAGGSVRAHAAPGLYATRVLWHVVPEADGSKPLPLWLIDPRTPDVKPLGLVLDEEVFDVRMPPHMGVAEGRGLETLLTRRAMVPIESWPNLWQANMQGLFAITKRAKHLPWWKALPVAIAGRGNLFRMMAQLNTVGRNCRIHPTAVVELSVLGDDVEIGAYAVVRNCVVGNGALIDDHASVRACVVGAGASIANNNNVLMSVVYPRAFLISGPYQFSVFGEDVAIMHCICCDTRLDGKPVQAEVGPGVQVDSTQRYLGSCYGHRVRAGAGTITAPGRAIPNDVFFLPPDGSVVVGVDADVPRRRSLFTEGGKLVYKGRKPIDVVITSPPDPPK
jgi:carbonic anhydrase/acetyltransferase-like protein (isoleucine patch superfamily)